MITELWAECRRDTVPTDQRDVTVLILAYDWTERYWTIDVKTYFQFFLSGSHTKKSDLDVFSSFSLLNLDLHVNLNIVPLCICLKND